MRVKKSKLIRDILSDPKATKDLRLSMKTGIPFEFNGKLVEVKRISVHSG
jgi:hypothetical protein